MGRITNAIDQKVRPKEEADGKHDSTFDMLSLRWCSAAAQRNVGQLEIQVKRLGEGSVSEAG